MNIKLRGYYDFRKRILLSLDKERLYREDEIKNEGLDICDFLPFVEMNGFIRYKRIKINNYDTNISNN